MVRIFIPRMTGFNDTQVKIQLNRIKERFKFLTEKNIREIEFYSDPFSEHEGTLVTEGATNVCYPSYDMDSKWFKRDNPEGEVWEFK